MDVAALTASISAKLGIVASGRKDAVDGIPGAEDTDMAPTEVRIIEAVKGEGERRLQALHNLGRDAGKCLEALPGIIETAAGQHDQHAVANPPGADDGRTATLAEDRDRAAAAYKKFQRENSLDRNAEEDDRSTQLIWVAVIILLEGLANSFFFRDLGDTGMLGGFMTAGFISFANVGAAFLGGALGLRYMMNHSHPSRQLLGMACSAICLFACILVIALSASFRAEVGHVSLDEDMRTANALQQNGGLCLGAQQGNETEEEMEDRLIWIKGWNNIMCHGQWHRVAGSIESFLLLFVGLICMLLGYYKGYLYDDPYPGFGNVARHRKKAEDKYNDAVTEQRHAIESYWRQKAGALSGVQRHLDAALREAQNYIQTLQDELDRLQKLPAALKQLARELLSQYRSENSRTRNTPAPKYFGAFPGGKSLAPSDDTMAAERELLLRLRAQYGDMQKQADVVTGNIRRTLNSMRSSDGRQTV